MYKTILILKYIWLTVAIISILLAIHAGITKGLEEMIYFFVLTLVSLMMFLMNKKRHEKALKEKQD